MTPLTRGTAHLRQVLRQLKVRQLPTALTVCALVYVLVCALLVAMLLTIPGSGIGLAAQDTRVARDTSAARDTPTVKIGILPDVDSFPFIVARELGYFSDEGINVELVTFQNPVERDSAFVARAIDGAVSDILAAIFASEAGLDVKITSITNGRYAILGAPGSRIKAPADLAGIPVAVSGNTIIEYLVDRLLTEDGLHTADIRKIVVAKIPVRLQMLLAGQVKAVCLPDPLATLAVMKGANLVADSTSLGLAPGIMLFRGEALRSKPDAIRRVYRAYARAVRKINEDPGSVRGFLESAAGFPEEVARSYRFPKYSFPTVPERKEVEFVARWLLDKKLIKKAPSYDGLVTKEFIR